VQVALPKSKVFNSTCRKSASSFRTPTPNSADQCARGLVLALILMFLLPLTSPMLICVHLWLKVLAFPINIACLENKSINHRPKSPPGNQRRRRGIILAPPRKGGVKDSAKRFLCGALPAASIRVLWRRRKPVFSPVPCLELGFVLVWSVFIRGKGSAFPMTTSSVFPTISQKIRTCYPPLFLIDAEKGGRQQGTSARQALSD
jgi:hypothetical protein